MASAPPSADPLATLAALYASPCLVRLTALPRAAGWRLELSEDDGGSWSSLEPGRGHPTPAVAVQEGARLIEEWRASREVSNQAEVAYFFTEGRLERRKILILNDQEELIQVDGFAAKAEDGTWIEDISPVESIRKAKEHRPPPKPIKPGQNIRS